MKRFNGDLRQLIQAEGRGARTRLKRVKAEAETAAVKEAPAPKDVKEEVPAPNKPSGAVAEKLAEKGAAEPPKPKKGDLSAVQIARWHALQSHHQLITGQISQSLCALKLENNDVVQRERLDMTLKWREDLLSRENDILQQLINRSASSPSYFS